MGENKYETRDVLPFENDVCVCCMGFAQGCIPYKSAPDTPTTALDSLSTPILGPFIRNKISRDLHKTRT